MQSNIQSPIVFINTLLQGEAADAGKVLLRFFINSTWGIGGLNDIAAYMGIRKPRDEDFGQTMAILGVEEGPYMVVPLLGPTNPRDLLGATVDWFIHPLRIANNITSTGTIILNSFVTYADQLDGIEAIEETSVDSYAVVRSLYRQSRAAMIANGVYVVDDAGGGGDSFDFDNYTSTE